MQIVSTDKLEAYSLVNCAKHKRTLRTQWCFNVCEKSKGVVCQYNKFKVLEFPVTKYYLFFRNGICTREFKYGKTAIVESNIRFPFSNKGI